MTDPKETTNNSHSEGHYAGRPNADEDDPNRGSDVGGPAGGLETTLEDGIDVGGSAGEDESGRQARNPL
jgi:hypothetical protein